ncbi:MAG: type II toxin-antitoxin system RelE/ParE family toxin [Candidatus Thermoplasmatota archaeon]|nr:type II toxin-antitoxin system RelE/ParE family toxin [Candidatus Thermoplasmatota archaeon]
MPDYEIKWTETTVQFLEKMEKDNTKRILEKMKFVSKDPFHYIKRLKGVPLYSLRTGKYRIIMSIERKKLVILVVDVGNRKNVYDDL